MSAGGASAFVATGTGGRDVKLADKIVLKLVTIKVVLRVIVSLRSMGGIVVGRRADRVVDGDGRKKGSVSGRD